MVKCPVRYVKTTFNTTLVIKITVLIALATTVSNITTDFLVTMVTGVTYALQYEVLTILGCNAVLIGTLLLPATNCVDCRVTCVHMSCKHIRSVLLCSIFYCFNMSTTTIRVGHVHQSSQAVRVTLQWKFWLS